MARGKAKAKKPPQLSIAAEWRKRLRGMMDADDALAIEEIVVPLTYLCR